MKGFIWPVGIVNKITSAFGSRNTGIPGASTDHKGVDIAAAVGTPVAAAFSGKVTVASYNQIRGHYIVVDDGHGTTALYQHLSGFVAKVGETVKAGEKIALTGDSGLSSGPHLHFEIMHNGKHVDPQTFSYTAATSTAAAGLGVLDDVGAAVSQIMEEYQVAELMKKYWLWVIGGLVMFGIVKK